MTAKKFVEMIQEICEGAECCDECVLNSVTNGVCYIDTIDMDKILMIAEQKGATR